MVAIFQGAAKPLDKSANLATMERAAAAASVTGAAIIVFPELFLSGYNLGNRLAAVAEPIGGPSTLALAEIARTHRIALVAGLPERDAGQIFNSAILVDSVGQVRATYRKIHLFGEESHFFSRGDDLVVVDLPPFRVGLAICYDIEFPEVGRAFARAGANLIVVPTANMLPYIQVATTLVRARALENGVAIAYANQIGEDNGLTYTGQSGLVGPDGRDILRAGESAEALLCCPSIALSVRKSATPLATQLDDIGTHTHRVRIA